MQGGNTLEMKYKNAKIVFVGGKIESRAYLTQRGVGKWAVTKEEKINTKEYYEFCGSKLVTTDYETGIVEIRDLEEA